MNTKTIVAIAAILVVLGAGYAVARPTANGFWNGMMGYGNGNEMMGNRGMMGSSGGMMGGYGGMMNANGGNGLGHCAGYDAGYGDTNPITIEEAKKSVEQYLASTGNVDLRLTEVQEFENNFYADVEEKSTGTHAFELLVNKYTGAVFPEMGPNMMWNTKYGHMGFGGAQATVTREQALTNSQAYLDNLLPGTKADEVETFYGYYTIHVTKDGKLFGMLSVHGTTGAVWYHNWHGAFVKELEVE